VVLSCSHQQYLPVQQEPATEGTGESMPQTWVVVPKRGQKVRDELRRNRENIPTFSSAFLTAQCWATGNLPMAEKEGLSPIFCS